MAQGQIKAGEVRFNCQLSEQDLAKLGEIAKQEGRTRNNLVRWILTNYIREYDQKNKE